MNKPRPTALRIYTYPILLRLALLGGLAIGLWLVYSGARDLVSGASWVEEELIGLALAAVFGAWLYRASGRIELTASGVRQLRLLRPPVELGWDELAALRAEGNNGLGLVRRSGAISSADGRPAIHLEAQLERYLDLVEELRRRRPDLWKPAGELVFQASPGSGLFVAAVGGFFIFAGANLVGSTPLFGGPFIIFGLAVLGLLIFGHVAEVRIEPDAMVVRRWRGVQRIERGQVKEVRLRQDDFGLGNISILVEVRLTDGGQLRMGGFRQGDLALYDALLRWVEG